MIKTKKQIMNLLLEWSTYDCVRTTKVLLKIDKVLDLILCLEGLFEHIVNTLNYLRVETSALR